MEDWLFHDSGDDPERQDSSEPSIETIVAAFRKAVGRKQGREELGQVEPVGLRRSGGEGSRDEAGTSPESSPPPEAEMSREESEEEPESPQRSQEAIIEDTIAAFRKALHRADDTEAEPAAEEEGTRDSEQRGETEPPEREDCPSEEEMSADTGYRLEDSIEEFAPAFREALKRRGGPGPGAVENGPDEEEAEEEGPERSGGEDRASAGPPESEVEPVSRVGDGVPPSEEVEISRGTSSDTSSTASSGRPPRPDESFLWVTDRSESGSASVSVDRLSDPRAIEADAFLLKGRGARPYELLTRIRGHSDTNVYLKPVFWAHAAGEESKVADHVDGEWTQGRRPELSGLRRQAATIDRRVSNMGAGEAREERGIELRVLRFMATRNHEFAPLRTVENADGFVYPKLSPLLERDSKSGGGELVQVLSMLEDRRLLTGEFVMRQHACHNCGCAFLNFEEMCPHCGSTDIDTDDLVHHFRCAFTGLLSKFKKEKGRLVCPKCDRTLRQIGVDYDKPSVVHTCRRCHEQFQGPEVQTTCYRCEHTNPPEQQIERQVKKYEVTALGEETAIYGLSDSLLSILERESRVLDYATFQLVVESEAARIERYQRSASSLLFVQIEGLMQLRADLGRRSQEVIEEIATAFDNTLRSSDYLSSRDESLYLFLLTETDKEGARRAGERLEQNIEGVLGQNLKHPPNLRVAVQSLRPDVELDYIAEQFLASQARTRGRAAVNGR